MKQLYMISKLWLLSLNLCAHCIQEVCFTPYENDINLNKAPTCFLH